MTLCIYHLYRWHYNIKIYCFSGSHSPSAQHLKKIFLCTERQNNVFYSGISDIYAVIQYLCCNQHLFIVA